MKLSVGMAAWFISFVSVMSSLLLVSAADSDLRLELASVLFRHGDRSPELSFPTNPYTENDWPQGYGQLSKVGMQQEYHLGGLLMSRYIEMDSCDGLVCSNYTRVQVTVRSTDYDRTLMSAAAQLSALFPPDEDERFEPSLHWQPIPIHTTPKDTDKLLKPSRNCPAYDKFKAEVFSSDPIKAVNEENKEFFAWLSNKTGESPLDMNNLWAIENTLYIQDITPGYENPSWVDDALLKKLRNLSDISMAALFATTEMHRLTAGPWLGKVLYDMKNKSALNGDPMFEDLKLLLYSAHDITLAAMMDALNIYDMESPGYASVFLVELYSDKQNNYFVKMFRRYGPDSDQFVPLKAPFCEQNTTCTLGEFEKYVLPLVPSDLEKECNAFEPKTKCEKILAFRRGIIIESIVVGILILIVLVFIISIALVRGGGGTYSKISP